MTIAIHDSAFDPWAVLKEYQQTNIAGGKYGATAVFVGTMRDFNEGADVRAMTLEHYPGMTEKYLQKITDEAAGKWDILDSLIVHRVGDIKPDETIVLVVVWSAHRAHAYEANRYLMEHLKSSAPFWKKETLQDDTQRWVEKNTAGDL
jgi:molybdopterin synthase catalytic subunit